MVRRIKSTETALSSSQEVNPSSTYQIKLLWSFTHHRDPGACTPARPKRLHLKSIATPAITACFLQRKVGEYGLHNTPAGMKQIIDAAVKVCPALADLAIERTWAGLRPVTPDTFPVLGASHRCPNLFVAGGYWRNGVLLAPKTAQIVADAVCGSLSPEDAYFLQEFSMDRFTNPGTSASGAATAREAAPRAQSAAAVQTSSPAGASMGSFISEASPSEILEMERAALEGANDGGMLAALEGMFGKGAVQVEVSRLDKHVDAFLWSKSKLGKTEPEGVLR